MYVPRGQRPNLPLFATAFLTPNRWLIKNCWINKGLNALSALYTLPLYTIIYILEEFGLEIVFCVKPVYFAVVYT